MKRSEMIKLIIDVLESFKRIVEADDDAKAVAFLTALEEAGMQPPAYEKLVEAKGIASPSPEMKLFYKMPCNEWEAE